MATSRLLVVLLLLVAVALLAFQNTAPALPLVFLGLRTQAYPLAFWLVGAIALGSLTSLVMVALTTAGSPVSESGRRPPNRYGRRIPYDPNPSPGPGTARDFTANASGQRPSAERGQRPPEPAGGGEWGEWTNLQSPSQWDDWSQVERQASGQADQGNPTQNRSRWGFGRGPDPTQRANESWQEISEGWDDLENVRYRARGVSPVADALDELEEGWDDDRGIRDRARSQDYEPNQAPKRVYRDGSIYSYSYRDAPLDPSDQDYDPEEYDDEPNASGDLQDPRLADDGVVDADYRVIIPPYRPLEVDTEEPDANSANYGDDDFDDDDDWVDGPPSR